MARQDEMHRLVVHALLFERVVVGHFDASRCLSGQSINNQQYDAIRSFLSISFDCPADKDCQQQKQIQNRFGGGVRHGQKLLNRNTSKNEVDMRMAS